MRFSNFVAAVVRFGDMRIMFRKSQIQLKKWPDLPPSGSGWKNGKPPKPYKYAVELAFLVDVFKLEVTEETYTQRQDVSDLESNVRFISIFRLKVNKIFCEHTFSDYINHHCQSTEPSLLKYLASWSRNSFASTATRLLQYCIPVAK